MKNTKKAIADKYVIHERKPSIPSAKTFVDRKKKARKNACRCKVW